MAENANRKIEGGVIGNFVPLSTKFNVATQGGAVGDIGTGIKIPKGKVVVGYAIKNLADDLAGTGATLQLKVGSTAFPSSAITLANAKGKANSKLDQAVATTEVTEVKLTVGTANLTAGNLELTVFYV